MNRLSTSDRVRNLACLVEGTSSWHCWRPGEWQWSGRMRTSGENTAGVSLDKRGFVWYPCGMGKFGRANTSAMDVANYILELAERDRVPIDPITLQKILYYCHCWSLYEGTALFDETVEAWKHGPLVQVVWKAHSGSGNIRPADSPRFYELSADEMELIQGVWQSLRGIHGFTMSKWTHERDTAWSKARGDLPESANSRRPLLPEDMAQDAAKIHHDTASGLSAEWDDLKEFQA